MPVHAATPRGWLSPRGRVLRGAWIGVLTLFVPPAWRVVYFVLGLCLLSHLPYAQVLREMASGLERRLAAAGWRVPAATALTRARRRIWDRPLEILFRRLCGALTPGAAPWSHIWDPRAAGSRSPAEPGPPAPGDAAIS